MAYDENVKESFQKVKQDIDSLKSEIAETRERMMEMCDVIKKLNEKIKVFEEKLQEKTSTHEQETSTYPTHSSTHHSLSKPLNTLNLSISTGNEGVPTDKQTNRQTDKQTEIHTKNTEITDKYPKKNTIDDAAEILDSLDSLKKEIRLKFKRLTDQEFLIFSALYQLDEQYGYTDYKTISKTLNLSESSIRDYIGRLIKKGIPVEKIKINNKYIQLRVSQNIKKIASLQTILKLREL